MANRKDPGTAGMKQNAKHYWTSALFAFGKTQPLPLAGRYILRKTGCNPILSAPAALQVSRTHQPVIILWVDVFYNTFNAPDNSGQALILVAASIFGLARTAGFSMHVGTFFISGKYAQNDGQTVSHLPNVKYA